MIEPFSYKEARKMGDLLMKAPIVSPQEGAFVSRMLDTINRNTRLKMGIKLSVAQLEWIFNIIARLERD